MKKKSTKLKDLLNESVLGQLPSSQMFKYNKATGKYEAPGSHSTNEEIEDQLNDLDEAKNDFMARGMNANIYVKNMPNEEVSQKVYDALVELMKKHKVSPKEITFKF